MTSASALRAMLSTLWKPVASYATFVNYCCVGTIVTATDFAVFILCFYRLALPSVPSKLFAFSFAVAVGFILHRVWTFRSRGQPVLRQFPRFILVSAVGAVSSCMLIYVFIDLSGMHPLLANALTSVFVLTWNFLSNKLWTFRITRRPHFIDETPLRDLTVIVPAYNEEHRLGPSLQEDIACLEAQGQDWEIIVVDDGSQDRTAAVVQRHLPSHPGRIHLLRLPRNRGKGAAVQLGVVNATGRFILIVDADNATPIDTLGAFLKEAREDEILIGSRYVSSANIEKRQANSRVLIGRAGNLLIRFFLIEGISDTQCGFKLFPGRIAKDLFCRQRTEGWGFDMEILSIAQAMGLRIREKGVTWRDVPGSRLRPIRAAIRTLLELATIKINIWCGLYD